MTGVVPRAEMGETLRELSWESDSRRSEMGVGGFCRGETVCERPPAWSSRLASISMRKDIGSWERVGRVAELWRGEMSCLDGSWRVRLTGCTGVGRGLVRRGDTLTSVLAPGTGGGVLGE